MSKRDEAIKALEEKKAEEMIRNEAQKEAVGETITFKMSYKCSALFMIKKKYPNLTQMEGNNIFDLTDGSELIGDLNIRGVNSEVAPNQIGKKIARVGDENVENVDYNPFYPSTESDVFP